MAEALESDLPMPTSQEPIDGGDFPPSLNTQNPTSPSSSSSSSSGSDSDDSDSDSEAQQNLQLQTLESELSNNPSNYDAHVQVLKP